MPFFLPNVYTRSWAAYLEIVILTGVALCLKMEKHIVLQKAADIIVLLNPNIADLNRNKSLQHLSLSVICFCKKPTYTIRKKEECRYDSSHTMLAGNCNVICTFFMIISHIKRCSTTGGFLFNRDHVRLQAL